MATLEDLLKIKARARNGDEYFPEIRISIQTLKDGYPHILIHQMDSKKNDLILQYIVKDDLLIPYGHNK